MVRILIGLAAALALQACGTPAKSPCSGGTSQDCAPQSTFDSGAERRASYAP